MGQYFVLIIRLKNRQNGVLNMSKIKTFVAVVLALVLCLSLVGCHPQNEIALKIGGVEITSAMYGCALIQADIDARGIIDEKNGAIGAVKYRTQTIDGIKYDEWVEDRALDLCKLYAAYTLKMKELGLELSEETENNVYQECYYDWLLGETIFSSSAYTSYASLMEPNGVSFNTFYELNLSGGMDETIFSYYYGKEGKNKIPDADIDKFYTENFALIYNITLDYADKATDKQKTEVDTFIKDLKTRLEAGEDFAAIKKDLDEFEAKRNPSTTTSSTPTTSATTSAPTSSDAASAPTSSEVTSAPTSSAATSSKEEPKPKDDKATLVWGEAAGSNSDDNFQNIKTMTLGEVKLLETDKGWRLIKKLDLMGDVYYRDINYLAIANLLKGEDFGNEINTYAESLAVEMDKFAMSQYTIGKLDYSDAQTIS